ncbi:hypothetical protein SARC_13651 [Sphaeroforma arctica JP610]|uniref:C2H2-type domain-containing protein n=1 Tax=Sphaeroforma arctica JP610 TaxID=667725 RepID=A0A0L0FCI7_9EUKA|nr:hypothetical protein SARC_13651 [Sphaeroforma arctica JP610]KNC73793.1 hypothetical protein SARC_13651 [Sphaeroforma arctica JP610]|eukprot:XP_014147695.1 hypothetical protein SARC_13651 [Sphaeroforma arctica JP610]
MPIVSLSHSQRTPLRVSQRTATALLNPQERSHSCMWPGCTASFDTAELMKDHVLHTHFSDEDFSKYTCDVGGCERTYVTKHAFEDHRKTHSQDELDGSSEYKCEFAGCGKTYRLKSMLDRHIGKIHSVTYVCDHPGCGEKLTSKKALRSHRVVHKDVKSPNIACPVSGCQESFSSRMRLKAHIELSHPSVIRDQDSRTPHSRDKEMASPDDQKQVYACDYPGCNRVYMSAWALKEHRERHRSSPYDCGLCTQSFAFRKDLLVHRRTHSADGVKPIYKCDHPGCDRSYVVPGRLARHKATHKSATYKCDYPSCIQTFGLKGDLARHRQTHNPNRSESVFCDHPGCSKSYRSAHALAMHKEKHLTATLACPYPSCTYTFVYKQDLARHVRTHGAVYPCDIPSCRHIATTQEALNAHKATHSTESRPESQACD